MQLVIGYPKYIIMSPSYIIQQLSQNQQLFNSMLETAQPEEYNWKPTPEHWSMLQVLCHLVDEEREDFPKRLNHCLETPDEPFDSIDPQGWVESRKYSEQNFESKLDEFMELRSESIGWLKSLKNPPWKNFHDHAHFGKMSARFFLENWLAHDYLHIRQIHRLRNGYFRSLATESLEYAGNW